MERLIAKMGMNFKNGLTPYRGAVPNPANKRLHAFSAVAFLAALAVGLLFLLPGGLLQAQDDGTIMYAENGMGPVATYTAVDPEMTEIVSWSLDGTDAGVFDINDGVLTFKKSPDYEMPTDVVGTDDSTAAANDNMYEVTVQATDETNKVGMKEVMVEVTNMEERGMVTLSALRPHSATAFTATLTDPDGGITGTTWQWAKASSMDGSYMDIEDETSMSYRPVDGDIGSFLRATASYTDAEGSDKSEMMMSEYSVQAVLGANEAPDFPDQDPDTIGDQDSATRMVPENTAAGMAIGDPVVAEDANDDILTYTLTDSDGGTDGDSASFSINWATGQIMTKAALDAETTPSYIVVVRATDPAGVPQLDTAQTANSDVITVTITVTDVNEPPEVTGNAEVTFNEVADDIGTVLHNYSADDPETQTTNDDSDSTWSVAGDDGDKFVIGNANNDGGELKFRAKPDFEMPGDTNGDNVYEITVVAADAAGNRGTMDVKVTVANEDEVGTVTLSRTQPRVGVAVKASLTDPDGSISGLTWQWYRDDNLTAADPPTTECADATSNNCVIKGAMSDTHTPTEGDMEETLTAVAMYTDGQGAMKTAVGEAANAVAEDTRNKPPMFVDQDTEMDGVQNESTERMVEENVKALAGTDDDDAATATDASADNVGSPVMAEDPDPNTDPLIYTLSGADASSFRVRDNGQIEVAAGTELDYETETTYMVTLMAKDSFGASDTIMVTIMVTDMDEMPEVTGDATREYPEKGMGPVATYTAVDPEMTEIVSWSLDGTDAGVFDINDGVLTFKKSPDYEMPTDVVGTDDSTAAANDNMYEVTVQATDETNKVGMKEVMVEVTNVEEPGMVTLSALRPQSAIMFTATLTDPDSVAAGNLTGSITTGVTWQWAKASSRNGSYSNIEDARSTSYDPDDADIGSYLRATASYTDGEGSGKSAMEMSDYSVQRPRGANAAPVFPDQDPDTAEDQSETATRMVPENTAADQAIGDPVEADDADGDILTYTLTGTDADSFDINWATGQIMTKEALDAEASRGVTYTVVVRATDPAGVPQGQTAQTANSDVITVTITVTDVNEPPSVTGDAEVTFNEVDGDITAPLGTYTEDDPETNDVSIWSVVGTDSGKFEIDTGGELTFEAKPDFEMPGDANGDNVYEVTVVAADAAGNRGTMDVKVTVANEDEEGTVTLSQTQPRVGVSVKASLTDPDGSISGLTWQWYDGTINTNDLTSNAIEDAMSDTYTPTADDATNTVTLQARAMYTDGQGAMKSAVGEADNMVAADTRNRAPMFEDQDTEMDGVQNESTERMVEENVKALAGTADDDAATDASADNVGSPVTAEDPDPNEDPLIYTLSGADASSFRVRDNGQIEVAAGTMLNHEMKDTYMVTLMAEDSFGASDTIMVTIMVTDVDEVPEIMVGGLAISGRSSVSYAEDRRDAVATYTASGPDAASATWSLSGDDAGDFRISSGGVLTFGSDPDYENPADMDMDNVYMVTIMAADGTYMDTHDVMVMVTNVEDTVTNVDNMGEVTLWAGTVALTMAPQVGETITGLVVDPDGGVTGETWQWSRTMDTANMSSWMDIPGETNAAYTVTAGDEGYYLRVMATYTDAVGTDMDTAHSMPTMMVPMMTTEDPVLTQFDSDDSGGIEKDEVVDAIRDYLGGVPGISKSDVVAVINYYLDSDS